MRFDDMTLMHPVAGAALALVISTAAFGSSDDAWAEFREAVRAACAPLVEAPEGAGVQINVNPFGSEHYGAAIVTVTLPGGGSDRMICIYDKPSGTAEMTGPFGPEY